MDDTEIPEILNPPAPNPKLVSFGVIFDTRVRFLKGTVCVPSIDQVVQISTGWNQMQLVTKVPSTYRFDLSMSIGVVKYSWS